MNPVDNPYAPGAGTQPPELAGRDGVRHQARIALQRVLRGRPAKGQFLLGLRGVGKTVLLNALRRDAQGMGYLTLSIEAPEERSLPAILAPELRLALLKLSRNAQAKALAQRGLRALAGFVNALKLKYRDIQVSLDFEPEAGLADNGDLEHDLQALLETCATAAAKAKTGLLVSIDELQYVKKEQLAALITALHHTSQEGLPLALFGAGLPQIAGRMGKAKTYAERLFEFPEIGALDMEASREALVRPAEREKVSYEESALTYIFKKTEGYAYFLQEWGKHSWDSADSSPIRLQDVKAASKLATAALDGSFFRVRFDRLTPAEKRYLRAMAELGGGTHRSGEIARVLGREVQSLAPTRNQLIAKGMVWSPGHGDTAFTVPLFEAYMCRVIPELNDLA